MLKLIIVKSWLIQVFCTHPTSMLWEDYPGIPTPFKEEYAYPNVNETSRIRGGRITAIEHYPFVIFVLMRTPKNTWAFACVANLISRGAALTAAQCLTKKIEEGEICQPFDPKIYSVVGGVEKPGENATTRQQSLVKKIELHPKCDFFNWNLPQWDAAVVVFRRPFRYNKLLQPLKIFSNHVDDNFEEFERIARNKEKCYAVGYGETADNEVNTDMRTGETTLLTHQQCTDGISDPDRRWNISALGMCCASAYHTQPCYGDLGAPLVCNGFVFGVYNWRRGCFAENPFPAVYADVSAVTYFVNKYTPAISSVLCDILKHAGSAFVAPIFP